MSRAITAQAVLFDLDGLLVDTEPMWTRAEIELAGRHGARWLHDIKERIAGTRLEVAVPLMLRSFGVDPQPALVAETAQWLLDRMVGLFAEQVPVRPGALALVDAVRAAGVPTGLVSSSFRVLVDAALGHLGPHRFDLTLAGDEVRVGKPDPEPYLVACARLGVDPAQVVVLEDASAGVAAAEAAGCLVVAVPDVAPIPALPRRPVHAALTHIDPAWLLSLPPPP